MPCGILHIQMGINHAKHIVMTVAQSITLESADCENSIKLLPFERMTRVAPFPADRPVETGRLLCAPFDNTARVCHTHTSRGEG